MIIRPSERYGGKYSISAKFGPGHDIAEKWNVLCWCRCNISSTVLGVSIHIYIWSCAHFQSLETLDNGKTYNSALADMVASIDVMKYYAGWCDKITGKTIPIGECSLLRHTTPYITHFLPSSLFSVCLLSHTEANMLSHWRNQFHQWMHQKLLNDVQLRHCSFERSLSTRSANLVINYRYVLLIPALEVGKSCRL